MFALLALVSLSMLAGGSNASAALQWAGPALPPPSSRCVGTIASLSDVSAAVECTTVNILGFTVPAGQTFSLDLLDGTTINVLGDILFGNESWPGPLFSVRGNDITFNGNGKIWDGGGPFYWDGRGTGSGTIKPHPMMQIEMSGTLSDVYVVNAPAHCFSLINPGPLVVSGVVVDNSQGSYQNANSDGRIAGGNTDGFDVGGSDLTIQNSRVINQDDCLAIKWGERIVFQNNYCEGGHGISIGSITSDVVVEDIVIQGNTVLNSQQAFRIKTDQTATNSRVFNVTYSDNVATGCTSHGVVITQSYPAHLGAPGNGVIISDINFYPGTTTVSAESRADVVAIDCGEGSCQGTWDWSGLKTSGGKTGLTSDMLNIAGYP